MLFRSTWIIHNTAPLYYHCTSTEDPCGTLSGWMEANFTHLSDVCTNLRSRLLLPHFDLIEHLKIHAYSHHRTSSTYGYHKFCIKTIQCASVLIHIMVVSHSPMAVSLQVISHHFLGRLAPNLKSFHTMPKSFRPDFINPHFLSTISVLKCSLLIS